VKSAQTQKVAGYRFMAINTEFALIGLFERGMAGLALGFKLGMGIMQFSGH
jgi:hypothetical protein